MQICGVPRSEIPKSQKPESLEARTVVECDYQITPEAGSRDS